jgi:integrase
MGAQERTSNALCVNVVADATSGAPSRGDLESMARRRCQNPKPEREGHQWVLRYWSDEFVKGERIRKRKREVLAPATMPEREVRKIALEFLRPLNQGLVSIGSATNFGDFVDGTYVPVVLPQMAKSTRDRYVGVIRNYLKPQFGGLCLREISVLGVDRYFAGIGKRDLDQESLDKIRDVLSSICGAAVRYGLLVKNPVEGVRLPRPKRGKKKGKPWITQQQFESLISLIREPYATMVYVAIFTGLRVSEIIGLRWGNVHHDSINVEDRYCRGEWGAPKSDASNATIPVNRAVIERIHQLKMLTVEVQAGTGTRRYPAVKSCGPGDLVFQSVKTGDPMRDNNILVRHIKPAARESGLAFVNWRCLRTSYANWLRKKKVHPKDTQALMRHSRIQTTMEIYLQDIPESQREAVDALVN